MRKHSKPAVSYLFVQGKRESDVQFLKTEVKIINNPLLFNGFEFNVITIENCSLYFNVALYFWLSFDHQLVIAVFISKAAILGSGRNCEVVGACESLGNTVNHECAPQWPSVGSTEVICGRFQ